jgi:glycosyltransferase involved in cell wall biosynthesis
MKVLVATEDMTFSVSLSLAYKAAGHEVSAGLPELYLGLRDFDLIHFHWPEELTQWEVPPLRPLVERLFARLDVLKPTTRMICTVHNLLPHADDGPVSWDYYNRFYQRMDLIGHFSQSSLDAVRAKFPDIAADKHFIHGMNDFADLKVHAAGQAEARAKFGIPATALVVAVVGQMRSMDELGLLAAALAKADAPTLYFLRAFRPPGTDGLTGRLRRKRLMQSFDRRPTTRLDGFLEDVDLVAVCEAADIIIIPRMENQLNSGVLPLAMTFGTGIVAPDCGVFRETLGGSMNELYAPGDAADLAKAITRFATKDPAQVRSSNLALSADWGWAQAAGPFMAALPK